MTVEIRPVEVSDAPTLAELSRRTFLDAFHHNNDPDHLAAYMREAFALDRLEEELRERRHTFFFAFAEGEDDPAGYAKLRRAEPETDVRGPKPVEIERLYVDQGVLGLGVGAALMEACLDTGRAEGFETIWLGVWEHNPRAIRFYEKWGFEVVGSHVFMVGPEEQTDRIMERSLWK